MAPHPDLEQMIALHKAGTPLARIASQLGCAGSTVAAQLAAAGIRPIRTQVRIPRAALEDAITEGLTSSQLARRLGASPATVSRAARREGLELPTRAATPTTVAWPHRTRHVDNPGHPFMRLESLRVDQPPDVT